MKRLHYEVTIDATRERVWDNVVLDEPYRQWTAPFHAGSYFDGTWQKGSRIRFLADSAAGVAEGMVSEIAESRRPEFISIRHLGIVTGGVEDTTSEQARKWTPAYENYTLTESGGRTVFAVDLEVDEAMAGEMDVAWPEALQILKRLSEQPGRRPGPFAQPL